MVILSVCWRWFSTRRWGRHMFAIGGNEHAAKLTGVTVSRVKFQAYVLCALTAALRAS